MLRKNTFFNNFITKTKFLSICLGFFQLFSFRFGIISLKFHRNQCKTWHYSANKLFAVSVVSAVGKFCKGVWLFYCASKLRKARARERERGCWGYCVWVEHDGKLFEKPTNVLKLYLYLRILAHARSVKGADGWFNFPPQNRKNNKIKTQKPWCWCGGAMECLPILFMLHLPLLLWHTHTHTLTQTHKCIK